MAATIKMVAAAEKLAERFGLEGDIMARVRTQRGDPQVRQMQQREAVAELLEALLEKTKPEAEPKIKPTLRASSKKASD